MRTVSTAMIPRTREATARPERRSVLRIGAGWRSSGDALGTEGWAVDIDEATPPALLV
jgi:hypothetical protein